MGPIVVIGSINMDLVCRVPRLPAAGETVLCRSFAAFPGGKGANQAVAAARLGGLVHLVGRVGDDEFGRRLLAGLRRNRVRTGAVKVTRGTPSGLAMILVDSCGENSIAVSPGANHRLSPRDIDAVRPLIERASAVVMQLEVPLSTIRRAVELCRKLGVHTILDPAPAPPGGLPAPLMKVDVLTPNEIEAEALAGRRAGGSGGVRRVARDLAACGARAVVLKRGAKGALFLEGSGPPRTAGGFRVKVVDTTAAGDAFTGALAVARSEGWPLEKAVAFANAAGALACTRAGAQPALPRRREVERLLASRRSGRLRVSGERATGRRAPP